MSASLPTTPPPFPGVLPAAFEELRRVVEARAAGGFARVLAALSPAARDAVDAHVPVLDGFWVEAVDVAEEIAGDGRGALARAVGEARADAVLGALDGRFQGDPLGFLRTEAASFYRERANYGAASLEVTPRKATLRLVASSAWTRRIDGCASVAPLVPLGFLDRVVERLSGVRQAGRYAGAARRADAFGGVELLNLLYEYDLEPE